MDLHLRGKRVLITGASKGIGAAAAEAFAEEGCNLALVARNKPALDKLASKLRESFPVDLRRSADLEALATQEGNVDVLVNNAGDVPGGSLESVDEATWRHAWDLK